MKWKLFHPACILASSSIAVSLLPLTAAAALSGYMELDYSRGKTTTVDAAGNSQASESTDFLQRYSLRMQNRIMPYLSLDLGYFLEKDLLKSEIDTFDFESTRTRMSPSAGLSLANPLFRTEVGYNALEAKRENEGALPMTMVQKRYSAFFGLARREDRPTFDVSYLRSIVYDKERIIQDTVTDQFSLSSAYRPARELDIRYRGSYIELSDRKGGVESKGLSNSGQVSYSDQFWNNRMSFTADYIISVSRSETSVSGTGAVTSEILPAAGLAGSGPLGTDIPPETPASDTLVSSPSLIDGNTAAGSGINIGYSAAIPGPRNMGLDLGAETELNTLFVWINQQLPNSIVNSFSWNVYVSSDTTDLKQWTLWQTIFPAFFGIFDARFELRFLNVKTRFIKVVTGPLASPVPVPGVDVNNILVTELQAFIARPAQELQGTTRSTVQTFNASMRTKIADVPNLYYDVYYWQTKTDPGGTPRYLLSNGLSLSQRLSRVFSTSARVSRDDSDDKDNHRVGHTYSASVTATPLNTLTHALVFSERKDEVGEQKSKQQSLVLNNSATPYRGIDMNLSGGLTDSTSFTGQESKSAYVTFGSTLRPRRTMTINLGYADYNTRVTEAGTEFSTGTRNSSAGLAYTPFITLYLFAGIDAATTSDKNKGTEATSRTQNYSASWSPQSSGTLTIRIAVSQTLTTADNGKNTAVTPGIRWVIRRGTFLDAGYQLITTRNDDLTSRTGSLFASLKVTF